MFNKKMIRLLQTIYIREKTNKNVLQILFFKNSSLKISYNKYSIIIDVRRELII